MTGDLQPWLGPHNGHLADADGDRSHCGACGTRRVDCSVPHCRYRRCGTRDQRSHSNGRNPLLVAFVVLTLGQLAWWGLVLWLG